jgi:hypothetical protein
LIASRLRCRSIQPSARLSKHPGDLRRELLPESRAQTQARPRQLNGNTAHHHDRTLHGITAIAAESLRDRRGGSDFATAFEALQHEAIFGARRSVENDPFRKWVTSIGPKFATSMVGLDF